MGDAPSQRRSERRPRAGGAAPRCQRRGLPPGLVDPAARRSAARAPPRLPPPPHQNKGLGLGRSRSRAHTKRTMPMFQRR
eukprot:354185-Chlamydomonas_euryale.AAC.9